MQRRKHNETEIIISYSFVARFSRSVTLPTIPFLCDLAKPSVSETAVLPEETSGPSVKKVIIVNHQSMNPQLSLHCEKHLINKPTQTYLGVLMSSLRSPLECGVDSSFKLGCRLQTEYQCLTNSFITLLIKIIHFEMFIVIQGKTGSNLV